MSYTLVGRDGHRYVSEAPGTLGGHARTRVYGRLDCPVALSWIRRGSAMPHRIFGPDQLTVGHASVRPADPPEVLSLAQLSELVHVPEEDLAAMAEAGELPGRRIGRAWRVSRAAVLAWLAGD